VNDDDRAALIPVVLAFFTAEELLALCARRADAEARHAEELAGDVAGSFWTEVEGEADTAAAFDRIAAQWSARSRTPGLSQKPDGMRASSKYGTVALEAEVARLRKAEPGERNQKLNLAAYNLGQLVGAGHLEAGPVIDALYDTAKALGLPAWEVKSTIRSGLDAGTRRPRTRW
jgi:hypothetical protein